MRAHTTSSRDARCEDKWATDDGEGKEFSHGSGQHSGLGDCRWNRRVARRTGGAGMGVVGDIIVAFIGAVILLFIVKVFTGRRAVS